MKAPEFEMQPFEAFEDYRTFKNTYKRTLKTLSMKRDSDLEQLLLNIWEYGNKKFSQGYLKGIEEMKPLEESTEEEFVGLIDPDEDFHTF